MSVRPSVQAWYEQALRCLSTELSPLAVAIVTEEGGDFQGGDKETGECKTSQRNVAVVGVPAEATSKDNMRRAGTAARQGAANNANDAIWVQRKMKERKRKSPLHAAH